MTDPEFNPEENPYEDHHDAMEKGLIPWSELIEAREIRGLSQKQLSLITGIGPDKISIYEAGKSKPCIDNLRKLAEALECSVEFLMGNTEIIKQNVKAYDAFSALDHIEMTHEQDISKEVKIIKTFIAQTEKRLL